MMQWESVIGLEVHAQLNTHSKIFAATATEYGAAANAQACDFSIALPGTLPVMNRQAARLAVKFGLAINAEINRHSLFARKHYFYPDLPKGYQISQYEHPIVGKGSVEITAEQGVKVIRIARAHLEEDAGKSRHEDFQGMTGIDLNRAGTPLLEIVSEPDLRSAAEAVAYLKQVHALLRYLEISDGNMQEGSFRCDVNVSVRPAGQQQLGVRAELKNVNSFRFIEKAIDFEIARQISVLEDGGSLRQETRLYDAEQNQTRPMRSKEEDHDYRYFPDPDLPPLQLDECLIAEVRAQLPELPTPRKQRFQRELGLSAHDAEQLISEREMADYFEAVKARTQADAKTVANWILGELSGALNKHGLCIAQSPVNSAQLALLLERIADRTISGNLAKQVFHSLWHSQPSARDVDAIIAAKGLTQITDRAEIETMIERVVRAHAEQVAQYRQGKSKVFGFLVGQVMQASAGKANPQQVNQILQQKLGEPEASG